MLIDQFPVKAFSNVSWKWSANRGTKDDPGGLQSILCFLTEENIYQKDLDSFLVIALTNFN